MTTILLFHIEMTSDSSFINNIIPSKTLMVYTYVHFANDGTCQILKHKCPGVSISTDDRRNASATLLRVVGYFSPEEEATSLNNVMGKKRGSVCNL